MSRPQAHSGVGGCILSKCVQKSPCGHRGPRLGSPYPSLPQAPAATCPVPKASGGQTAVTPALARMGAPASPRTAIACVRLGSEAPPARDVRPPLPSPYLGPVSTWAVLTAVGGGATSVAGSPAPTTPLQWEGGREIVGQGLAEGSPLPPSHRQSLSHSHSLPAWPLWQTLCALQVW